MERVSKGRAKIKHDFSSLEIIIPNKITWTSFAPLLIGLIFLTFIFYNISKESALDIKSVVHNDFFHKVFVFFLLYFLFSFIKPIIWIFFGEEIIIVDKGILSIKKAVFGFGLSKKYEIKSIRDMTVVHITDPYNGIRNFNRRSLGKGIGKITFDYGMKTIKFAYEIDEAEAKKILKLFRQNRYFKEENFAK